MLTQDSSGLTELAFFRPGARSVRVAGDFNAWQPAQGAMLRDGEGWWRVKLDLDAGEYRFRYLVDDQIWEADFAAFGVERQRDGSWTSVAWVERRRQVPAAAPVHMAA